LNLQLGKESVGEDPKEEEKQQAVTEATPAKLPSIIEDEAVGDPPKKESLVVETEIEELKI